MSIFVSTDNGTTLLNVLNAYGNLPQGGMVNGKIVTSVSSSNLTVALKTLAGTDPSATDPIYVRIANTIYTITTAINKTRNAGTNWFNAGSAELATQEIDYFVYLRGGTGVDLVFSRLSNCLTDDDWSSTSTSERFGSTNASTAVECIGRFNAILSAGGGYTWSIPATSIVINKPIYESRWLSWTPTITANGSSFTNAPSLFNGAFYRVMNNRVQLDLSIHYNSNSGGTGGVSATLPMQSKYQYSVGYGTGASSGKSFGVFVGNGNTTQISWANYDSTTPITNNYYDSIGGIYQI